MRLKQHVLVFRQIFHFVFRCVLHRVGILGRFLRSQDVLADLGGKFRGGRGDFCGEPIHQRERLMQVIGIVLVHLRRITKLLGKHKSLLLQRRMRSEGFLCDNVRCRLRKVVRKLFTGD